VFNATSNFSRGWRPNSPKIQRKHSRVYSRRAGIHSASLQRTNKTFFFAGGNGIGSTQRQTRPYRQFQQPGPRDRRIAGTSFTCPNVALYLKALAGLTWQRNKYTVDPIAVPSGSGTDLRRDSTHGASVVFSNGLRSASQSNLDANHLYESTKLFQKEANDEFSWLYDSNTELLLQ